MSARPPSPSAQFSTLLSRFPPEIVALVKRSLPKLRRSFPGTLELVYDYTKSLVVAFGTSERGSEAIVAMSIARDAVRLYFDKSLPDPKGLLEGSGSKVRSVALESAADLDRGDLRALVLAAIERSGVELPRGRPTRKVVKSGAKARRAKKAARG